MSKKISHLRGGDNKPLGRLSKVISDITKGGGCPAIGSPIKKYSVLRYFSRMQNSLYPTLSGVVGDGGKKQITGTPIAFGQNLEQYYILADPTYFQNILQTNINLNTKVTFNLSMSDFEAVAGTNNYLNISNQKEFVSSITELNNTVCNIEKENSTIVADGSGYYNYYLYKPNHTMDIIPAGETTPVSKTAELMEFVFFHCQIPRCKNGELYLEIEDFEIVGSISKNHYVYFYYWESNKDKQSIKSALKDNVFFGSYPNILDTNNSNLVCKTLRLSDLQGAGSNKKLVVWLNKKKLSGQALAVNVAIGLKPNDLRKDYLYRYRNASLATIDVAINTDEPADILFKFKKSSVKIDRTKNGLISSAPFFIMNSSYKNLSTNQDARVQDGLSVYHHITLPIWGRKADYSVDANQENSAFMVDYGFPNGGATSVSGTTCWNYFTFWGSTFPYFIGTCKEMSGVKYLGDALFESKVYFIGKTDAGTQVFNPTQNYRLKLPSLFNPHKNKATLSLNGGGNRYPTTAATSENYVLRIYAGDRLRKTVGQFYSNYKTFVDGLVLIGTKTQSEISAGYPSFNSGASLTNGTNTSPTAGNPYPYSTESYSKKNQSNEIEFLGSLIPTGLAEVMFYISWERELDPIKSISYGKTNMAPWGITSKYHPTSYSEYFYSMSEIGCLHDYELQLYSFPSYTNQHFYKNYDCAIYQAPQIIDKTSNPESEKYFI